jgi:hypothetical protein
MLGFEKVEMRKSLVWELICWVSWEFGKRKGGEEKGNRRCEQEEGSLSCEGNNRVLADLQQITGSVTVRGMG